MSRLNAGAYEFVPGQTPRPPQVRQDQQGQQQRGPPVQPPFQPPAFDQYGRPLQPQYPHYGQQGYPQQQYWPQQQVPPYYNQQMPPQHFQQQQQFQQPTQAPRPPASPAPQPDRPPSEPQKPVTISLNIGGSKATPPPQEKPAAKAEVKSAPPKEAPAPAPKAASKSGTSTPRQHNSGTDTPTKAASKAKGAVFTMDRAKNDADIIVKDQTAVADEDTIKELYGEPEEEVVDTNIKLHLNVVFTGHVDAGKSTLGGQILVQCGMVDKRTLEKWERESKDAGRETWYLTWALDSTPQERDKGKTVEVGRGYFETDKKRYTILDAPGHKTFVPSMITGAAQADVSVLVISARKGEFETGFERGGQTREHITLVRTAGVNKIVVVINKMDDPTVEWDKARFDEIKDKVGPFARASGYSPKSDLTFIPVSAYTGLNIKSRLDKSVCSWWDGPSLLEYLDNMPPPNRKLNGPVMIPISEKYNDMGTVVVGKLESGRVCKGDPLVMMPNHVAVEVMALHNEMEDEVTAAFAGDNVRLRLRGVDDKDISPGFVITSVHKPVHAVKQFIAQLAILEHKNIICAGYSAVMHVHTLSEEVSLLELLHYLDKKTGKRSKKPPQFAKKGMQIIAKIETTAPVCIEPYKDYPQLGRFTLRDEGKTVAMGKVLKLVDVDVMDNVAKATAAMTVNE